MWYCTGGPMYGIGHGMFMGGGFIGLAFNLLIISTLIYFGVKAFRHLREKDSLPSFGTTGCDDSINIIRAKFAKGEITEEEYKRMKEVLSN